MSFGQVIWPGGTAGSPHSSVATCRTVARSLVVNPAGSTSRTCRPGGMADRINVILVSFGTARHSAVSLADPAPIMTPPGFTPGEDRAAAPTDGACDAEPDVAVPATVVPQAASPITSPAVMPPSAARLAAPTGAPSVLIATPFRPGRYPGGAPLFRPLRPPTGQDPRGRPGRLGRPRGLGAGRVRCAHARRSVLVRAGLAAPNPPALTWTGHGTVWFRPARLPFNRTCRRRVSAGYPMILEDRFRMRMRRTAFHDHAEEAAAIQPKIERKLVSLESCPPACS